MKGPVAPQDPIKKRDYFYIIHDKQIFGSKQPDGRGIQFLFMNDGRMISNAAIVGNVTDEEMLKLLKTTEGFRRLVHSIGVSLISNQDCRAKFVYQMYGKTDTYGSGTNLEIELTPDGVEYLIPFNEVEWSDDDDIPGQIRFEFEKAEQLATVSVKLYLNDGFKAPLCEPETPVDFDSDGYKKMIDRSLIWCGNNSRIKTAIDRARSGGEVTIAFIGGSITQGAGATPINTACYAYRTYQYFKELCGGGDNIKYVKAGVGGTPSELGMIRYDREVTKDGAENPDIVVIEFAVNDEGDETNGECFESLVRKALFGKNSPAVILLFSVFADDFNLEERMIPVGRQYNLPMVSVKEAVTKQFYLTGETGRVLSKNQYFYDRYHPSNTGHRIMADCLSNLFAKLDGQEKASDESYTGVKAVLGDSFETVRLLDRKDIPDGVSIECGGFCDTDTELQKVERDENTVATPEFPYNWKHSPGTGEGSFRLQIKCRVLLIVYKDSGDNNAGKADVYADGVLAKTIDPREIGWTHCNPYIIVRGKESVKHEIEIKMHAGNENKDFTILGFGYVE